MKLKYLSNSGGVFATVITKRIYTKKYGLLSLDGTKNAVICGHIYMLYVKLTAVIHFK